MNHFTCLGLLAACFGEVILLGQMISKNHLFNLDRSVRLADLIMLSHLIWLRLDHMAFDVVGLGDPDVDPFDVVGLGDPDVDPFHVVWSLKPGCPCDNFGSFESFGSFVSSFDLVPSFRPNKSFGVSG